MTHWSTGDGIHHAAASPLRKLVAGFPGAAAHVSGDRIWLNTHAEEMTGYTNDELPSLDAWGDAVYRTDEPEARAIYLTARDAGFPRPETLTIIRKDGVPRLVEFSGYLGDDEEVWVLRDVTDSRRAEQELREREQRLQVAATTAGLGIWEWEVTSDRIRGDTATRRLLGLGEQPGTNSYGQILARLVPEDREMLASALSRALENRRPFDVEVRVMTDHSRNRWLRIHGTVLETDAPRIIGAVRDIDSYKRLDERLVHAARMESLGQLAGGVAHDFNNLLAVIQGQTEFVAREPGLSEKAMARLHSIERAVSKGAGMVSTLMQLGRSSAATADIVDVHDVLRTTADSLDRVVGEDVTVELQFGASASNVQIDESRLSAVILNLVTNARDAMPVGGLLSISTSNTSPSAIDGADRDIWFQMTVEDTGVGMEPDVRARIFEPFFTTKAPGVGTGLGLASVYDAVMDAGGTIDVRSTPGEGSTFVVSLPCAPAQEQHTATAAPPASSVRTEATILVVEDDPAILEMTADILRSGGYRVIAANGSEAALGLVENGDVPDLLLSDVVMPGLSGPQLADRLSERLPHLAVLFMSGYTSDRGGAPMDETRLIRKPFSHDALLRRLGEALTGPGST